ncbi:hypothetical protein PVAP13_5NG229843 [Panicum virgatum]|uniref:Uncharacterized protein n=1 Tax=Panicum virgatum TaxID=38727 RepID=A0A8T0RTA2_PANVG|nr:hypothetical protein PVAP13_5NG229843 [Panicum virgatum]
MRRMGLSLSSRGVVRRRRPPTECCDAGEAVVQGVKSRATETFVACCSTREMAAQASAGGGGPASSAGSRSRHTAGADAAAGTSKRSGGQVRGDRWAAAPWSPPLPAPSTRCGCSWIHPQQLAAVHRRLWRPGAHLPFPCTHFGLVTNGSGAAATAARGGSCKVLVEP